MDQKMLTIKAASYLGVHKLVKRLSDSIEIVKYHAVGITKTEDNRPAEKLFSRRIDVEHIVSKTPITHELHLSGNTLTNSEQHIEIPNQDVCIMGYLLVGSDIKRPNNSRIILYNDDLYYCLTWTDVIGDTTHNKTAGLRRQEEGRYIAYLQLAPSEYYDKVVETLIKEFPGLYAPAR